MSFTKWDLKATKHFAKQNDVTFLRDIIARFPTIIGNMDRARQDLTNTDRKWAAGQHMVLTAHFNAAKARLAVLEGK